MRSTPLSGRKDCGSRWTCPRARRRPSAAWPATTPVVRARSVTATWCTTCSASTRCLPTAASTTLAWCRRIFRAFRATPATSSSRRRCAPSRRAQGYNLDFVRPRGEWNFAQLLVGSEGTLAYSRRIHLKLSPLPRFRTLGACHFRTFRQSMEAPQHVVKLGPTAVELVDRTMIGLARSNPAYRAVVEKFVRGDPDAILLVEFVGDDRDGPADKLERLSALMADLGHPDSVIRIIDPALQRDVWDVRKAGLNIMMSMKGDGKPVSFIED